MNALFQRLVPLQICGDSTDGQKSKLREILNQSLNESLCSVLEQIDTRHAQTVLDNETRLRAELSSSVINVIMRFTSSALYEKEIVSSKRVYPTTYKVRTIEAQVSTLRALFPGLKSCNEKLGHRHLPDDVEAWFAIPRWQRLAPTYNEALSLALARLAEKRRMSIMINESNNFLGPQYLRHSVRSELAEDILASQQPDCDILVVGAQFGMRHRGTSARRARAAMAGNEFGLGSFAIACMLLTHPERLSQGDNCLTIDCSGDEYAGQQNRAIFDRVPLFDFDLGCEFSTFYDDRTTDRWGTPTGFVLRPQVDFPSEKL